MIGDLRFEPTEPVVVEDRTDLIGTAALAVFNPTKSHRYLLTRRWDSGPALVFVMLNPSTADAFTDDPTIRRCVRFARRDGHGAIAVLNLYALRATDPRELDTHPDPIGPDNDGFIRAITDDDTAGLVVAAWGAHTHARSRANAVTRALRTRRTSPRCLGLTRDGSPRHPLYVHRTAPLLPYTTDCRGDR
jgi:hypothetical protein